MNINLMCLCIYTLLICNKKESVNWQLKKFRRNRGALGCLSVIVCAKGAPLHLCKELTTTKIYSYTLINKFYFIS